MLVPEGDIVGRDFHVTVATRHVVASSVRQLRKTMLLLDVNYIHPAQTKPVVLYSPLSPSCPTVANR
jgi:hypothetical protein